MTQRSRSQRTVQRDPIRPERVRRIGPDGFAFIPNRFLRQGFFAALRPAERELYFLLVLAGDRNGVDKNQQPKPRSAAQPGGQLEPYFAHSA